MPKSGKNQLKKLPAGITVDQVYSALENALSALGDIDGDSNTDLQKAAYREIEAILARWPEDDLDW